MTGRQAPPALGPSGADRTSTTPAGAAYDVVIPTAGRESLRQLLLSLDAGDGPLPERILVVDDRVDSEPPLALPSLGPLAGRVEVLRSAGIGPAGARNRGWRAASAQWVTFLDDDVVPAPDWCARLAADLAAAGPGVVGVQGRIEVPLPPDRPPTDWERNVAGLEGAVWATADIAYRRSALAAAGGFDERFRRAYREDSDLGLRLIRSGRRIVRGDRRVLHPVRAASPLASLRLQAGNADDVLMRALHGAGWRDAAGAPRGRRSRHLATTAAGVAAIGALAVRRGRLAVAAGGLWAAATAELAWARIAPGPRTPREVLLMAATSVAMPVVASAHWFGGLVRHRALGPIYAGPPGGRTPPRAVLLDRDGTLIVDVPYNADPVSVRPVPGARRALDRLRAAGLALAVVSNQSGIGRGLLTEDDVRAVNRRVEELLGPLGPWFICPHAPDAGCDCRKPRPGLVLTAARSLGVDPAGCAVVGDIGADIEAARAAGARGLLVPTRATRPEEIVAADEVAPDLEAAVDLLLGGEVEAGWPAGVRSEAA